MTFSKIVATMESEHLFGEKGDYTLTKQETELIETLKNCSDFDYAVQTAIEIFTSLAEQPLTSQ